MIAQFASFIVGMSFLQLLGWTGGILFALCSVPQVILTYRQGNAHGLSWGFLLMWTFGELFTTIYVWPKQDWPLLFNYFFNLLCLFVILWYKLFPKERK